MPNTPPRLVAGGNIYPCRFVKMSTVADDRGLQATANDAPIGISYPEGRYAPLEDVVTTNYHAITDDPIGLYGDGEQCLLEIGDDVTRGGRLKSDADGKGVPVLTTGTTIQQYGAIALESGSSGEKIRVFVLLGSERPALTT
jgi:hypothetical protein